MPRRLLYCRQLKIKMTSNSNILLEQLFGSKARLLKLFLQHPQLILSTKDITKRTSIKIREVEKIISFFTRSGILKKINGNGYKKIKKNN